MALTNKLKLILSGEDRSKGAFRSVNRSVKKTGDGMKWLKRTAAGLFTVLAAKRAIVGLSRLNDTMVAMKNKLRLVTTGTANLAKVQKQVFEMSQRTRSSYEASVTLYARVARSANQLGIAQENVLKFTELAQKAIVISGVSMKEAASGAIQLAQGIASNRLSGDELRSVLENTPRLAQAIAEGIDAQAAAGEGAIGMLRRLAKQGRLTGEVVIKSLLAMGGEINGEFEKVERTVGQALTQLKNEFLVAMTGENGAANATNKFIEVLDRLRDLVMDRAFQNGMAILVGFAGKMAELTGQAIAGIGGMFPDLDTNLGKLQALKDEAASLQKILDAPSAVFISEEKYVQTRSRIAGLKNQAMDLQRIINMEGMSVRGDVDPDKLFNKVKPAAGTTKKKRGKSATDILRDLENKTLAIQNETRALTMNEGAIAKMEAAQTAMNALKKADLTLTAEQARTMQTWLEEIEIGTTALGDMTKKMEEFEEVGTTITSSLESAFSSWVETGKLNVRDMVRSMIADLSKLYFSRAMQGLLTSFTSVAFGGVVGANSNTALTYGLPGRAAGGPVTSGSPYMVGERGPEMFVPPNNGKIIPNNALSGGGTVVNITNNSGGEVQEERRQSGGMEIVDIVINAVNGGIAGGKMDGSMAGQFGARPVARRR